ncbi:ABC transporter substrate-binding protein [Marinospirillum alkaliphilum]|uniref:Peptide/nickel transport system substrate-binding protein n=1 Tax=Marinospirillum alkaliphilum DSM 21637 TaxID=1122209 RepID=A0A1K1Y3G6_9GAMM|nr:ABC transporter substrate-binding protein [Marinospirillum alkaliphilum]SFX56431.1 peptide/nickel transport system substrate-binding protein [Marinospirillum alkaliphilum DSM 21637]
MNRGVLLLLWCLLLSVELMAEPLRVELHLRPPHLDPTRTPAATLAEATYNNIFQGLTRIDRDGQVQPNLAHRWQVAEDGLSWTFELQPGVVFHDLRSFNAEVAAWSIRRMLDPAAGNPQRHLFGSIREVESINASRLRLHLHHPDGLLPFRLGLSAAVMVHPETAAQNHQHPVGTGPYHFVSWDEVGLRVSVFRNYWGVLPSIHDALFTFTSNRLELEAGLLEGRIDLYPNVSALSANVQLSERTDYVMQDGLSEGQVLLVLNHAHPALQDVRVRRALTHAVDRQALLSIYPQTSPPLIGSHFSPRHPAYVDLSDLYPHDRQQARVLLQQAGYAEGLQLRMMVPPPLYARESSLLLADALEQVGIDIELIRMDWSTWLEQVFLQRDYDLTVIAHVEPFDMDIYARDDYYFNYRNPAFNQLWQKIEQAVDEQQRNQLLQQAQKLLAEDAAQVFLHIKPQQAIRKKNLQGSWLHAPVPAVILEELYWR